MAQMRNIPEGFADFVQRDGCKCFPPLAEPTCPVHGHRISLRCVDFAIPPPSDPVLTAEFTKMKEKLAIQLVRSQKYESLRFAVMELIAQTMNRVPSVLLGWDKGRLDEITALCK